MARDEALFEDVVALEGSSVMLTRVCHNGLGNGVAIVGLSPEQEDDLFEALSGIVDYDDEMMPRVQGIPNAEHVMHMRGQYLEPLDGAYLILINGYTADQVMELLQQHCANIGWTITA